MKKSVPPMALIAIVSVPTFAQVVSPPVPVPKAGCDPWCVPIDQDPCCLASMITCTRTDVGPYITNPGTPGIVFSTAIVCDNCFADCPCCPESQHQGDCADCNRLPSLRCVQDVTMNWSFSTNIVLSTTLTASLGSDDIAAIKSSMMQSIGVTAGIGVTANLSCGWPAMPPCQSMSTTPSMTGMIGVTAQIDHTWGASGVWITARDCTPCPITGNAWSNPLCRFEISTISGNPGAASSCGPPVVIPCPPEARGGGSHE